jgi:hypothetical protein
MQLAPSARGALQLPVLIVKFVFAGELIAMTGVATLPLVWLVTVTGQAPELPPTAIGRPQLRAGQLSVKLPVMDSLVTDTAGEIDAE